ncbi:DNRLRE domain-containing protein [Actinomadura roseirufa]|uniref:DNRLRE domain-containing protein n=1 Tax=Actinomadura roseirufa TaxID=2094049 RepID=UPI001F5E6855|nr:DNRLRE domain-containing protein [Actinomadura roseirufa]
MEKVGTRFASAEPAPAGEKVVSERLDRVSAQLTARLERRRIEVSGERSESSSLWANPDGTFTTESYAGPVRVREGGTWKPIDTTLIAAGGAVRPRTAPAPVVFSAGGSNKRFASIADGKRSLAMEWAAELPAPQLTGNTAVYKGVVPDGEGDLLVSALPRGFSHSVVLNKPPVRPVELRLPIALGGMQLKRLPGGQLELTDDKGAAVAGAPAPRMWDATKNPLSGDSDHQAQVPSTVEKSADGAVLVLKPDPEFFKKQDLKYPVTIDPTQSLAVSADTYVANTMTGSQYNSADLITGTWDAGSTLARSYVQFNTAKLAGKHILSADFRAYAWWSSACTTTGSGVQVRRVTSSYNIETIGFGSEPSTTATGAAVSTASPGGACPQDWMHWNTTSIVQAWADGTANNGFQIRAVNQADSTSWRRFRSSNYVLGSVGPLEPRLDVTWNSYPAAASKITSSTVVGANGTRYSPTATPTLTAAAADADGGTMRMDFEVAAAGGGPVWSGSAASTAGVPTALSVPAGQLNNGASYQWRVRGYDGTDYAKTWSSFQAFTVDTTLPDAPAVSCPSYPQGTWSSKASSAVTCTLSTTSGDGAGYYWSIDDPSPQTLVADPNGTGGDPLTVSINPSDGWHTLYAKTRDSALNTSSATAYAFGVGVGSLTSPQEDDRTQAAVSLTSGAPATKVGVTYKYRVGTDNGLAWTNVPIGDVTPPGSSTPISGWPVTRGDTTQDFTAKVWNLARTVKDAGKGDGPVQIKACFTAVGGTAEECSAPVTVTLERSAFGASYATGDLGPGQVSLLTGDYSVGETDVNYSGLVVSRSHTTLVPSAATGPDGVRNPFGPGWTSAIAPDNEAGMADFQFADHSADGYVSLTGSEGQTLTYSLRSNGQYQGIGDADDGSVITKDSSTQFTFTDIDGTTTRWVLTGGDWRATSVTEPGGDTRTFTYDPQGRITRILAPVPAGVSCGATLVAGCRALAVTYADTTTATGVGSGWGDYAGQVKEIAYVAYDPASQAMKTTAVAVYRYDSTGHLRQEWDPRISPALTTTYYYNGDGRISQITPPGLAPWEMSYDSQGRVVAASRQDGGQPATETVAYDIPLSGTGAPTDLSLAQTATWGQDTNLPRIGTAIFPASHVPPANGSAGGYEPGGGDWKYGRITYLDVNGRAVDMLSYGAGAWQIAASRYDDAGNQVWALSESNRLQALSPTGATDLFVATRPSSAERADLLATAKTYDADGGLLTSTGPTHPVELASGATVSARQRTTNTYDEGKPDPDAEYHLLTTSTVEPVVVDGQATPEAADTRTAKTGYAALNSGDTSGWELLQPTSETFVIPGGTDVVRRTRYDDLGRIVETRASGSDGTDPGTKVITYYTAAANGTYSICGGHPEWAGQVCRTGTASQPGSGPNLPVKLTTYDYWGAVAGTTETRGSTQRTVTITHDGAGRVTTQSTSVTPAANGGTAVPDQTVAYSASTGAPISVSAGGRTITTGYDALGRISSYTDSELNVTTKTYDIDGGLHTLDDGKGTYTYHYGGTDSAGREERRPILTRLETGAGSSPDDFTGSYDPDGRLIQQVYPNGLTADTVYGNAGAAGRLTYSKSGGIWLQVTSSAGSQGQTAQTAGPESTARYSYDGANRLTKVEDTYLGDCRTRKYTFDARSNRTGLDDYSGGAESACSTGTTPTTSNYTYDSGDRLTNSGYSYDTLGRTTAVPGGDALGGTAMQIGYHADDMVAAITQGSDTLGFSTDPSRRIGTTGYTTGSVSGTLTNHYGDAGDSPTWIGEPAGGWTRNITDLTGALGAVQNSTGTVTLQLPDLGGDVVATVDDSTSATGLSSYAESTEYGGIRDTEPRYRYGWLGSHLRSQGTLGGIVLMGERLYLPTIGRFLQTDPVEGGSCNDYEYTCGNPVDNKDLDGRNNKENAMCIIQIGYLSCNEAKHWAGVAQKYWDNYHWAWYRDKANDGGPSNAFKHAFWNALMTFHQGIRVAAVVATNHEKYSKTYGTPLSKMDLRNNILGRNVGNRLRRRHRTLSNWAVAMAVGKYYYKFWCANKYSLWMCY